MANKRIGVTLDINADISKVRSAAEQLQNIFKTQGLGAGHSSKLTGMFTELDKALDDLQKKSSNTLGSMGDIKGLDRAKNRVTSLIASITEEFTKLGKESNIDLGKNFATLNSKIESASRAIKTYNTSISNIGKTQKTLETNASNLNKALAEQEKLFKEMKTIRSGFDKGMKDADILSALKQKQTTAKGVSTKAQNKLQEFLEGHGGEKALLTQEGTIRQSWAKANPDDVEALQKLIDKANAAKIALDEAKDSYETFANGTTNFKGNEALKQLRKDAEAAANELKNFDGKKLSDQAFTTLKTALEGAFGPELTQGIENGANAIDQFKQRIESISTEKLKEFRNQIPEINNLLNSMGISSKDMGNKVEKGMNAFSSAKQAASELDHLTSRLKYFFSLAGGFQLMRRAIRSAVETTKELDAVMTQTAVVSKYSVGDMWKTLPEYSKYAKQLGAEIKEVYSAQTLYVQQGLDMNSAMDLGIETLKMARVAGIDAAEATNSMTAALRGFNMELNETSATRINDVYSKLAQNTASNVQEISTAMSKVAALANSANMSFENTSAFLATIIESTREGAETAGTALKTVIARFTEVKKLYSEGELSGTDEEGQEVDVNKISKALRTAGINMNDFFTGAKGLDEIFMELGSKWDSLSTVQQRYIATMAAGSRQQSRFLALMQNYSRTVELTNMAYNSAGSGQEQFEKTLDSLEAKLHKLKAAWDTFTMGIANSDAIKWVIDAGTKILDTLNSIIDKISGGNGAIKSVLSLATAFAAFKAGGAILKGGLGQIGAAIGTKASNEQLTGLQRIQAIKARAATRFDNLKTGNQLLFNSNARTNMIDTMQGKSVEAAKAEAIKAQEAYNTARAELAKVDNPEYKAAMLAQAKNVGGEEGKAQAEAAYEADLQTKKDNAAKAESNLADANSKLTEETDKSNAALQKSRDSMQALGNAALMAGGMLITLASFLERLGTGGKVAAKVIKSVGIGLISFGSILKITQTAVAVFAKTTTAEISSIPIIGWIAAVISLLITLGSLLYNFWPPSASEKLEQAKADAEAAQEAADSAADAYDRLLEGRDKYHELLSQIEELTQGTEEYKKAVQELNQEVMDMANEYPELEYHYNVEKGYLEIDEDTWDRAIEKANKRKNVSRAISNMTTGYAKIAEESYSRDKALKENASSNYIIDYLDEETKARALKYLNEEQIKELTTFRKGYSPQDYQAAFENALRNFPHDVEVFSSATEQFSQALFNLSGGTAGEKVISEIYGSDFYHTFYNPTEDTFESSMNRGTDWKEWDFNEKAANGKDRKWDVIIEGLLEDGLIDIAQADIFKKADVNGWNGNVRKDIDNDWFYQVYSAITGTDLSDAKKIDYQQVVNYVGRYYESKEVQRQFDIDFETFSKLPQDLQDAWIAAAEGEGKLTKKQQKLLLNGGLDQIKKAFPYFDETKFAQLVADTKAISASWAKNDISENDYYDDNADKLWKRNKSYNEDITKQYEDLFTAITDENNNLTQEQINSVLSILNSSDITSLKDLWGGLDQLKEMGINLEKNCPEIYKIYVDYIKSLEKYGIAVNKLTSEQALEKTLGIKKIAKDKKDNNTREFSKDEYETIKELLSNTEYSSELSNFILTEDGTYKYYGEDLSTIIGILNNISNKIPEQEENEANAALKSAQFLQEATTKYLNNTAEGTYLGDAEQIMDALSFGRLDVEVIPATTDAYDYLENNVSGKQFLEATGEVYTPADYAESKTNFNAGNYIFRTGDFKDWTPGAKVDYYNDTMKILRAAGLGKNMPWKATTGKTNGFLGETNIDEIWDEFMDLVNPAPYLATRYSIKTTDTGTQYLFRENFNKDGTLNNAGMVDTASAKKSYEAYQTAGEKVKNGESYTRDELTQLTKEEQIDFYNSIMSLAREQGYTDEDIIAGGLIPTATMENIESIFEPLLDYIFGDLATFEKAVDESQKAYLSGATNEQLANIAWSDQYAHFNQENRDMAENMVNKNVAEDEGALGYLSSWYNGLYGAEGLNVDNDALLGLEGYIDSNLEDSDVYLKTLASELSTLDKKIEDCKEDLSDAVTELNQATKGSKEWRAAAGKVQKIIKDTFGKDLDFDKIEEGGEIIQDWLDGTEGSLKRLGDFLTEGTQIFSDGTEITADVQAIIDQAISSVDTEGNPVPIYFEEDSESLAVVDADAKAAIDAMAQAYGIEMVWEEVPPINEITGQPGYRLKTAGLSGSAAGGGRKKGGGGGGGKKEFKNDFDKYYNMVEDINELERLRNLLESDYNQLLAARVKSGKELYDNLKQQIKLLEEQRALQADLAEKRKQQIVDTMNSDDYKDLQKYAWWNEEDQTLEINWDLINTVKDSELGDRIKEYVSKMEGFQGQYDDAVEALEQIDDTLQEIKERGKEQYLSLESRVRDALIKQIQDKIDDLTAVDEAIAEANQKLLDSISEALEMQRQDRENAKTEESLADKEERLAYLRQDSSNANDVEIARLEKELAEERENYTDTLIDQKISELQKQNEKAQEQRQQQIDLMQQSLDYQEKTGAFWDQVYEYINNGVDAIGNLIPGSDLVELLKEGEAWTSLSQQGSMDWMSQLEDEVAQAVTYLALSRQLEDIGTKSGTKVTFTDANGQTHTGKVDKNGNVVVTNSDGSTVTWKDVYQAFDGTYHTLETQGEAKAASKPTTSTQHTTTTPSGTTTTTTPSVPTVSGWKHNSSYHWKESTLNGVTTVVEKGPHSFIPGGAGRVCTVCGYMQAYTNDNGTWHYVPVNGEDTLPKNKKGGLHTHTGPTWIDGTPSKPELILNARDTENFIQLKDVLADVRKNRDAFGSNGGDNYYDIDVHVDQMSSDYDVDRAIDRIKTRLYQDGAYRNVNTLSRLR